MIKGIHHISMKCVAAEELARVRAFYVDALGMAVCRVWSEGIMIDTGSGLIEVFTNGPGTRVKGAIRHVALLVEDVDETAGRVKAAGYEVFVEPNDKTLDSVPPYPFRMAFCRGPLGEEIEFFQERQA